MLYVKIFTSQTQKLFYVEKLTPEENRSSVKCERII